MIPSIIFLEDFKSFDDLYQVKDDIINLKLVPIKSDEMHKKYHSFSKEDLINSINFNNSNILLQENNFPYLLPSDVSQNLIWIKENITNLEINNFLNNKLLELNIDKYIIFERGKSNVKLVKGSFPELRHLHLWYKF